MYNSYIVIKQKNAFHMHDVFGQLYVWCILVFFFQSKNISNIQALYSWPYKCNIFQTKNKTHRQKTKHKTSSDVEKVLSEILTLIMPGFITIAEPK